MADIEVKQGEAKTVTFTITDSSSASVDCSGTTCTFVIADDYNETAIINKVDDDFDKASASNGILTIDLSSSDTSIDSGSYLGELKIVFNAGNIDISKDIDFVVNEAVE